VRGHEKDTTLLVPDWGGRSAASARVLECPLGVPSSRHVDALAGLSGDHKAQPNGRMAKGLLPRRTPRCW